MLARMATLEAAAKQLGSDFLALEKFVNLNYQAGERGGDWGDLGGWVGGWGMGGEKGKQNLCVCVCVCVCERERERERERIHTGQGASEG